MEKFKSVDVSENNMEFNLEKLPKSRFELIDLDMETDLFCSFLERGRFSSIFDKAYPELRAMQKKCKDGDELKIKCREFLKLLQGVKEDLRFLVNIVSNLLFPYNMDASRCPSVPDRCNVVSAQFYSVSGE